MSVFNGKNQNQLLLAKGKGLLDSGSSFLAVPEEQSLGGSRLPVCLLSRTARPSTQPISSAAKSSFRLSFARSSRMHNPLQLYTS